MVADKMVRTKWYGQNGIGQNGMDKMVWTNLNGTILYVAFILIQLNLIYI